MFLENVLLSSAIQTSEFLVLTQDTAYGPTTPGVCFVAGTAAYTVHGDVVRVVGPIACPGKSVEIVCRVLQLYPDSQFRPAAIVVDGTRGDDGKPINSMPKRGADGSDFGSFGEAGARGDAGNDGQEAGAGGAVAVFAGTLSLESDATVSAAGGRGGDGSDGGPGGDGGRGHDGYDPHEMAHQHLEMVGGLGGWGGHGGPGGAGNHGGRGGSVTVHYDLLRSSGHTLKLSVRGGDGGRAGRGGTGGRGGDTGTSHDLRYGLQPGGRGGAPGPGGQGGRGGRGGEILVANTPADTSGVTVDGGHGGQGADGNPGVAGPDGGREQRPSYYRHGAGKEERGYQLTPETARFSNVGEPSQPRAVQPTADADSKTDGSVAIARFRYDALRPHLALSQLRMLVERLRFLYLRLGRPDLSLDPTPDYLELLAGIQWLQDLLKDDNQIDAAFRDSWDGTIYFFRGGNCLRYDAATRSPLALPTGPIAELWPGLWTDEDFDTVTLGFLQTGFDDFLMPRFGNLGMFFRSGDVIFHNAANTRKRAEHVSGSMEVLLGRSHRELWNGIDTAVNATADGRSGYLFQGDQYYLYTLGPHRFEKIEGPFPCQDFPGLWLEDVTAAFTGTNGRVFFFQKSGTWDDQNKYHPPQYMVYNFDTRKIESGYPRDIEKDWPGLTEDKSVFAGADKAMAAVLLQTADSLSQNLRYEMDYFGNASTYVALETVDAFNKAKKEALKHLTSAENEYRAYQKDMNQSAQSKSGLQLAVNVAGTRRKAIEQEAKAALADSQTALAEINRLRELLEAKGKALTTDAGTLKDKMKSSWGVSWQDLFGCLTQFSFMHWNNLPEKVESGPVLMASGQLGDLYQKGISNVISDSGQSMNKDYLVRRVDSLTQGIRSLKDLTLTRTKLIDPTNLYNDAYKLAVTRDQFKELCDDFTVQFKAARKIINDLDEYVTLADQRNAAVLDYNQQWQRVGDLQAEAVKAELDFQHAQSGLAKTGEPNLPVFTSFATERYNRAKDQTLQIYYLASRAYILKSLEVRDRFSEVLSLLPATGQIDAATFDLKSLDDLYTEIMDELKGTGPTASATAHLVFEKATHPAMFAALARDGVATFAIQQATRTSASSPFANMANIRLTRVRCWAGGLAAGGNHSFTLVHTGRETFVTSRDEVVTVDHDPVLLSYSYRSDAAVDPTPDRFEFKGEEGPMALSGRYALLGPFTTWNIQFDDKKDRAAATSLRVAFDVVHQAFALPISADPTDDLDDDEAESDGQPAHAP